MKDRAAMQHVVPRRRWQIFGALVAAIGFWWSGNACLALSPESPEVRAAIDKGVAYISNKTGKHLGAKALIALVLSKDGKKNHPKIQEAVDAIREAISNNFSNVDVFDATRNVYSLSACIVLLTELDPYIYRTEIEACLNRLLSLQKPIGAWGYVEKSTGDTSMTQYAVLALWLCEQYGIRTPQDSWERVCNWLMRTQDPTGNFGYQGKDPGNFNLVTQANLDNGLAAAGMGSIYFCGHYFGFLGTSSTAEEKNPLIPTDLVKQKKDREKRRDTNVVDREIFRAALARGDNYFANNYYITPKFAGYRFYYLYALERYKSIREMVTGSPGDSPWYDDGARKLIETQDANGSWKDGLPTEIPDTCFSLLFLLRSMQKSIEKTLGDGLQSGNRGLSATEPDSDSKITNKIRSDDAKRLLEMFSGEEGEKLAAIDFKLVDLTELEEKERNELEDKLREAAGSDSAEARIAALQALSRSHDLANAPLLIEALKDPNEQVVQAAMEGLRFMSRKRKVLDVKGMKDTEIRGKLIEYWQSWYRSVRPDFIFAE